MLQSSARRLLLHQQLRPQQRWCGFLAAIGSPAAATNDSSSSVLTSRSVLDRATARLEHRGPDGRHLAQGTFQHTTNSSTFTHWSMGHQRLAIVDPDSRAADMPFLLSFDNNIHYKLVANGEIYNHHALYQELCEQHGWTHPRQSLSDCEVIAHACACLGPEVAVQKLDGMFAFCLITEDTTNNTVSVFAARDPVGIKPLYHGMTRSSSSDTTPTHLFSSELKALVGHVDPATVQSIPAGHYWTPTSGLVRYHNPAWLYGSNDDDDDTPTPVRPPTDDQVREAFQQAVRKRMMSDVEYGFLLSGGVDSCILSHALLPMFRAENDDRPIPAFTVGMEDSPDLQAAKAMVDALGGPRYVDHRPRVFTGQDVFDLIPKIIYHMETYEAELIRSAIPNWLLAERAGADVKMVLTGEGADELFAGYLYFMHATEPEQIQTELKRLYGMLGNINLHRTDRMTMAHGLEARVPFLDTKFTELAMQLDPRVKMVDPAAVAQNTDGREKSYLRKLFAGPNANGSTIPTPVLWRAKAMQCEGVGEDWVAQLQHRVAAGISDAELNACAALYPIHTPQTKEELFYRRIFEDNFSGMAHVVNAWEGGCRAGGASWESQSYTREGLVDPNLLTHAFQKKSTAAAAVAGAQRGFATRAEPAATHDVNEAVQRALDAGYDTFQGTLTAGGDDRCLIDPATKRNKYHVQPQPISSNTTFRGSCTCNAPTELGYNASRMLYAEISNSTNIDETLGGIFQEQRERIESLLQLPPGTEVILCPSGSDAEYLPIAIAKVLAPDNTHTISNIVTQYNEVGAGTAPAAGGQYFSTHAPLLGRVSEDTPPRDLAGFASATTFSIPARQPHDGSVTPASTAAAALAAREAANGAYTIVHGVYGGKTGLQDAILPVTNDDGTTSLAVIDGCQGRFTTEQLTGWLNDNNALVLFTASKFYQAPPFCGAVLVPPTIAAQLRALPPPPDDMLGMEGLGGFLSDKELPDCMDAWRLALRRNHGTQAAESSTATTTNIGLALRWEAGLAEMEAISKLSTDVIQQATTGWVSGVCDLVHSEEADSNALSLFCAHSSIVSIRLKKQQQQQQQQQHQGDEQESWLSVDELRVVYRLMTMDLAAAAPSEMSAADDREILATAVSMGQPVSIASDFGILRLALGSESLRNFVNDKEATLSEDRIAIRKLALVSKYFDHFKSC